MSESQTIRVAESPVLPRDPGGTHEELAPDLIDVAASLHRRFDPDLGSATVGFQIQLTADRFAKARIRAFVPLFVRRFTVEALTPRVVTR
jgi:hypothetical protein